MNIFLHKTSFFVRKNAVGEEALASSTYAVGKKALAFLKSIFI